MGIAAYALLVAPQKHFSVFAGGVAPCKRAKLHRL